MTNAPLDIQLAPRSPHVSVRGGRLTKFKGRVASIAPGFSIVATAAVLFSGGAAQAANECGTDEAGQDTVTCGPNSADPDYPNGITYGGSDGLTLILDDVDVTNGSTIHPFAVFVKGTSPSVGYITVQMEGGQVTTAGANGMAIFAQHEHAASNANVTVTVGGGAEITTDGLEAHGVLASNKGGGNAYVVMEDEETKITTAGIKSWGLWAAIDSTASKADAKATMTAGIIETGGNGSAGNSFGIYATNIGGGKAIVEMTGEAEVTTSGAQGHALYVDAKGLGQATVKMNGGEVTTGGSGARGLWAFIGNKENKAASTVHMTGKSKVETTHVFSGAHGLHAEHEGLGDATARMSGGEVITYGGSETDFLSASRGLWAQVENAESEATATVHMTGESKVETTGGHASGLVALTNGRGGEAIAEMRDGTVNTNGNFAYGLHAKHEGTGDATARMSGGKVITQGRRAHGLDAESFREQAIVNLDAGAVVTVYGEDAYGIRAQGATGFDVDVAGDVQGGSGTGAAIRTFSSAGGRIDIASTANVNAGGSGIAIQDGDGDAVVTSAGTITGDIHLGAGNDSLILTGGSVTGDVDGGEGTNDHLVLSGQTVTTIENLINWERLTLKDETELSLDEVATLDTALSIDARSVFSASGGGSGTPARMTIAGDVINNGSVVLSVQDGAADDVITIEGDYTGSGRSVVALDAVLAGNDANTDQLVITGDMSGEMMLSIAGLDSIAPTGAPLEIDVVTVGGESGGTFTLMGGNHVTADGEHGVISGAHLYRLAETGRGWALSALSSTGGRNWQPSAPIYDSYGQSLLALNGPASLRSRGSSEDFRSLAWDGGPATQSAGSPLWFQMGGERITTSEEHSTTGAALESSIWEMEIGGDVVVSESGAGLLVGGLMFSYATGSASVSSEFGDGSIDISGFGLGVAATWYDHRRFYVDGQVSLASYSSDLEADRIGTLTDGNGGTGLAFSIEAGQQLDLGSSLTVIPQAQLSFSSVEFDDFEGERYGEQVTLEDASSQQLRLGLEFAAQEQGAHRLYGIVNLFHEFGAGSEVDVAGASLTTESEPWAVGVGLGGNYALTDRVDLFGEASYATGLSNAGDTSALSANAGLKVVF